MIFEKIDNRWVSKQKFKDPKTDNVIYGWTFGSWWSNMIVFRIRGRSLTKNAPPEIIFTFLTL